MLHCVIDGMLVGFESHAAAAATLRTASENITRVTPLIDPGVDVCGVDRDVAEPVAHGVDVHTASKKMGRGRAPDRVRAHLFCGQGWHPAHGSSNVSCHQIIDGEARDGATVPV
jgi:hypothetical protein